MLKKGFKKMVADANAAVTTISPDDAKALATQPDVIFLDVREPGELLENGKIEGAIHALPDFGQESSRSKTWSRIW